MNAFERKSALRVNNDCQGHIPLTSTGPGFRLVCSSKKEALCEHGIDLSRFEGFALSSSSRCYGFTSATPMLRPRPLRPTKKPLKPMEPGNEPRPRWAPAKKGLSPLLIVAGVVAVAAIAYIVITAVTKKKNTTTTTTVSNTTTTTGTTSTTTTVPTSGYVFDRQWGSQGSGNGQFNNPCDISVPGSGYVLVVDSSNDRIQEFRENGNYNSQWGRHGNGDGEFNSPGGIGISPTSSIYIAGNINNNILKFSAQGNFGGQWGEPGTAPAQMNHPMDVAIDGSGKIYIANTGNHRIDIFAGTAPNFITTWGGPGAGNGRRLTAKSILWP